MYIRRATPGRRLLVLASLGAVISMGCGDDPERFPTLEEAPPLQLQSEQVGVGLFHGDALGLALNREDSMQESAEFFEHAFFRVKSYDEFAPVVGEYNSQRIREENVDFSVRSAADFSISGTAAARLEFRAGDLDEELDRALEIGQAQGFGTRSFVVDFWRERGDWLIRWDGNLAEGTNLEGQGTYGFDREDMSSSLLSQLATVAGDHQPEWIIVGDAMDRLYQAPGYEEGVSRDQLEAFEEFFEAAVEAIHQASPDTKVGAGFHWENVAGAVAAQLSGTRLDELGEEEVDEAFQEVILPFAQIGDGVALRSQALHGEMEDWSYQFLRRLPHLYGLDKPIVFYSVSTPIESQSSYAQQRLYLERFSEVTAGLSIEVVAWERLNNVDGVDTSDQSISGRCASLTNEEGRIAMKLHRCFDGLFSLFRSKDVFETFQTLVDEP